MEGSELVSCTCYSRSLFLYDCHSELTLHMDDDMACQTRDTIEKYCERFEKDMLRLFDRYYRKGDPKAMAVSGITGVSLVDWMLTCEDRPQHCAQTLQDFNGGQSCIQIYVNQHDFFISKDRVQDAAGGLVKSTMCVISLVTEAIELTRSLDMQMGRPAEPGTGSSDSRAQSIQSL